jgi:hypothetical protein
MTTTTLLHLMRKDLRAAGAWPLAIRLLALTLVLMLQRGQLGGFEWYDIGIKLSWLSWLLVAGLQVTLLQADPPVGSTRFIATRPVSGGTVIFSKALVILIAGVLPVSLATALRLWLSDANVPIPQIALITLQNALLLSAALALLALPDALPRRKAWAIGASILLSLLLLSLAFLVLCFPFSALLRTSLLLFCGLAGASAMGLVANYLRLSLWPRLISCLTTGLAVACILSLLIDAGRTRHGDAPPLAPSLQIVPRSAALDVTLIGQPNPHLEIHQDCHLTGLPEGVFAEEWKVTGQLQIQGRETTYALHSQPGSAYTWVVPPLHALDALPAIPGSKPEKVSAPQRLNLSMGFAEVPDVKAGDKLRLTVRGTHHFELFRTELAAIIPFENDRLWSDQGFRLKMSNVVRHPQGMNLQIDTDMVSLDPEAFRWNIKEGMRDLGFFRIRLPSRRISMLDSSATSPSLSPLQRQQRTQQRLNLPTDHGWWPYPGHLSDQLPRSSAEHLNPEDIALGIFRRIKVGVAEVPFEFINMAGVVQ